MRVRVNRVTPHVYNTEGSKINVLTLVPLAPRNSHINHSFITLINDLGNAYHAALAMSTSITYDTFYMRTMGPENI